jgi:hypothetical protein
MAVVPPYTLKSAHPVLSTRMKTMLGFLGPGPVVCELADTKSENKRMISATWMQGFLVIAIYLRLRVLSLQSEAAGYQSPVTGQWG